MIDLHLSIPSEVVAEVDALAERLGEPRSNIMQRVLRLGLDQLETSKTGQPNGRSRTSSRVGRSSTRRRKLWRCPVDWDIFDKLVELAESVLEDEPMMERAALKHRLAAAVRKHQAQDPVEVVERALNRVLGRPGAERARPVPGNPLPPD